MLLLKRPCFLRNCKTQNLLDFSVNIDRFIKVINLLWGLVNCHKNYRLYRFSRFGVCWIQTDRQTWKIYVEEKNVHYSFEFKFISMTTICAAILWRNLSIRNSVWAAGIVSPFPIYLSIPPSEYWIKVLYQSIFAYLYILSVPTDLKYASRYFTIYSCIYIFTISFPGGKYYSDIFFFILFILGSCHMDTG